jgi:LacI family transcriptional regulator
MVTIRDVAKESGFSSTTVSIVLNDAPLARYIPPVTKKRIERAAQKLGYRPNQFARSLRSKRSHTVGVMVFDMTDLLHAGSAGHREHALSGFLSSYPHRCAQ